MKRLSQQGRYRRGIRFLYNNKTAAISMEQVQISSGGAINYSPLFHEFSENSKFSKRENTF